MNERRPSAPRAVPTPLEPWQIIDLLSALVEKSLVVYEEGEDGQGRYRLLDTVRQYGRDRLLETGESDTFATGTAIFS
jgi:predicted ATPase